MLKRQQKCLKNNFIRIPFARSHFSLFFFSHSKASFLIPAHFYAFGRFLSKAPYSVKVCIVSVCVTWDWTHDLKTLYELSYRNTRIKRLVGWYLKRCIYINQWCCVFLFRFFHPYFTPACNSFTSSFIKERERWRESAVILKHTVMCVFKHLRVWHGGVNAWRQGQQLSLSCANSILLTQARISLSLPLCLSLLLLSNWVIEVKHMPDIVMLHTSIRKRLHNTLIPLLVTFHGPRLGKCAHVLGWTAW